MRSNWPRGGARVVVVDLGCETDGTGRDAAVAAGVVRDIAGNGGEAIAVTADVGSVEEGDAVVGAALEAFGAVDIVVASAGIVTFPALADTPPGDFARHLEVDPTGSLNVIRPAWRHLCASGAGRIVLTVSSALFGIPVGLGYGCAKGGTLALGRGCAYAGAEHGIKANTIAPYGFTRMMTAFERPAAAVAAKRALLPPESVAALVAYLAHDSCAVSGELFGVGGGRVTRVFYAETQGFTKAGLVAEDVGRNIERICGEEGYRVVGSNRQFVDGFYDAIPGFREAERAAAL